jgi:outer membrane protein TolC
MAARQSRLVEMARAGTQGAEARVQEKKAAYLPEVTGSVVRGARTLNTATFGLDFPSAPGEPPLFNPNGEVVGPINNTDLRGSVSQTLLDWSALESLRSARSALEASRMREDAAAQQAAAMAGAAYVRALGAQARLGAQETDLALARELVEIAREVLAAGVGVRLDLTRAEAQEATMNARLIAAQAAAERARLSLLQVLNLPSDTPLKLVDTLQAPGRNVPGEAEATQAALEERWDVRAADQDVAAAEMAAAATRHERLPTLRLGASDGWVGREASKVLNTYDWSLRVSIPVFNGYRTRAHIAQQEAQVQALELRREELQEQIIFQVRQALLDLQAADQQVEAVATQLRLAELEYQQARERFQEGVAGAGDVITAALRLNDARMLHVDALAASQGARVALAAAQGRATLLR